MLIIDEILELIKEWKEYKSLNQNGTLNEFGLWLNDKNPKTLDNVSPTVDTGEKLTEKYSYNDKFLASYYLVRLNKFIKIYTKDIFRSIGLNSIEEFSFLALIHQMNHPSKNEICKYNLTELSTGMDIIKRLIKNELVTEIKDSNDNRMIRMEITEKGIQTATKAYQLLNDMPVDLLAELEKSERDILIKHLDYLNNYHTHKVKN